MNKQMSTEDILREQVKELSALVDLKDARIAELEKVKNPVQIVPYPTFPLGGAYGGSIGQVTSNIGGEAS